MGKLIQLLNEYEKRKGEEYGRGNYVWGIDKENKNIFASRFPDLAYICEEESKAIIICKGYEFIKRLLDNDKIDLDMIPNVFTSSAQDRDEVYYCMRDIKDFSILNEQYGKPTIECLLMLLSIQDEPIEFLVSVLK